MSWVVLRQAIRCTRCRRQLEVGEQARFGDVVERHVWCVDCAKTGLLEDPPEEPPAQEFAPLAGSQRALGFDTPDQEAP